MAEPIPHLSIEEIDESIQVLSVMRDAVASDPKLEQSFRVVLTELHNVARNARDISDGD
ncbi:hypothetical protein [Aurantimicrobium sp.]|uniref:hypothetical protein n=1 Tax=Aurantimicrobium sp. TaxID=1930784 RepID=UPI002FCC0E1C